MIKREYEIVTTPDAGLLKQRVEKLFIDGWQLYGSISVAMANNGATYKPVDVLYTQVLTREKESQF